MEIATMVTLKWARLMVKESIPGQTERSMTANGSKASNKAMASGEAYIMTRILANGSNQKLMVMEFILGRTGTATKVSGIWR
jgi:hypothetical protein